MGWVAISDRDQHPRSLTPLRRATKYSYHEPKSVKLLPDASLTMKPYAETARKFYTDCGCFSRLWRINSFCLLNRGDNF